jgi:hypothetical protein
MSKKDSYITVMYQHTQKSVVTKDTYVRFEIPNANLKLLQTKPEKAQAYQHYPCMSVFWTGNLPRGVPEVDECGLAEIGNSKEETRGTQFRQVRAASCVIPYVLYAV